MGVSLEQLCTGEKYTVCEIKINGISTLRKFTECLTKDQIAGIVSLVRRIAKEGPLRNPSRFTHEEDGIYAIKDVPQQVRIYCFFERERVILLTNGAIKKNQKADPEDLKRAKELRRIYRREAGE